MHRTVLLIAGLLALGACRLAPRGVWVERGEALLAAADQSMREGGAYFAPYVTEGAVGEAEATCVRLGNAAVKAALGGRYALTPHVPPSEGAAPASAPSSAPSSAPAEPEYLIAVRAIRCQGMTAGTRNSDISYALKSKPKETRGELELVLYRRGEIVAEILGRQTARSGETAVQDAAKSAAARLSGGTR